MEIRRRQTRVSMSQPSHGCFLCRLCSLCLWRLVGGGLVWLAFAVYLQLTWAGVSDLLALRQLSRLGGGYLKHTFSSRHTEVRLKNKKKDIKLLRSLRLRSSTLNIPVIISPRHMYHMSFIKTWRSQEIKAKQS